MKCRVFVAAGFFLVVLPGWVLAADFNGDGADDLAIFKPSTGLWAVRNITRVYFGTWNDEPVPGNYDGVAGDEIAIYRASSGLWAIRNTTRSYYGGAGDIPVASGADADWYRSGNNLNALAAGNIGVGTGTPQKKLHLLDSANLAGIRLERGLGGESWDIGGLGTYLNLAYNGATLFSFTTDGSFGVGTDNPNTQIDVRGTSVGSVLIKLDEKGSDDWAGFRIDRDGSEKWFLGVDPIDDSFFIRRGGVNDDLFISTSGDVGIGTTSPGYKLDVNGDINTSGDVRRGGTAYNNPDYVFKPDYQMLSLKDLKKFLNEKQHLPGMPSSDQVKKEGVKIFEQNRLVLEKLEEAYLYILQQEESIERLEERLTALEKSAR